MIRFIGNEMIPVDQLETFPGNPNVGDVPRILESLRANGVFRSLIVRKHGERYTVLAGNHTKLAMAEHGNGKCGYEECAMCDAGWDATARCEIYECDDQTAARINIADNRIPEFSHRDDEALNELLMQLDDLSGSGYALEDLPLYIHQEAPELKEMPDLYAELEDSPAFQLPPSVPATKRGDVWTLGNHRVMCGDSREPDDVSRLLAGATVNLAFTSPPYASQRKYDEMSGFTPVPPDEYVQWFAPVAANVAEHLAADGSWFVNIKESAEGLDTHLYVLDLVTTHVRKWGWHYATEYVWERNGVPKNVARRFKNQFEPIYQFARNDWKIRPDAVRHASDSVPVSDDGADRPSKMSAGQGNFTGDAYPRKKRKNGAPGPMDAVQGTNSDPGEFIGPGLAYPGNRLPTFSGSHTATGHTAAFPVGLPRFFVLAYTDAGDTVYDPFMGSGSTLLAADQENRIAYGMEISPRYCDVTALRFQQVTGIIPVLNGTPHDFDGFMDVTDHDSRS